MIKNKKCWFKRTLAGKGITGIGMIIVVLPILLIIIIGRLINVDLLSINTIKKT